MKPLRALRAVLSAVLVSLIASAASAQVSTPTIQEPEVGQPGKDVVWVPSPPELVEMMLDVAKVTAKDFVVDLGSGDGRNVIAAAKRGARALGVEYDPNLVEFSKRAAANANVADKATFVRGDMYEADFSKANALVLFLLPTNLEKLKDKFLNLTPGTRIVSNTFQIPEWNPDSTDTLGNGCSNSWCTVHLYIVPAKIDGRWKTPQGEVAIKQTYQYFYGSVPSGPQTIQNGVLWGEDVSFKVGGNDFQGRVIGDRIEGFVTAGGTKTVWTATRLN